MKNTKISEFKLFVKANPFLINYIKKGEKTWQELYEVYDLYGSDEEVWNKYLYQDSNTTKKDTSSSNNSFNNHLQELVKIAKNIDVDKVQEGITSLQKTLSLFGDLLTSNQSNTQTYNPRPLYRRFED